MIDQEGISNAPTMINHSLKIKITTKTIETIIPLIGKIAWELRIKKINLSAATLNPGCCLYKLYFSTTDALSALVYGICPQYIDVTNNQNTDKKAIKK